MKVNSVHIDKLMVKISSCAYEVTKMATGIGKDLGQQEDLELPFLDLATISNATDNFASYNKLGEGGFGAVFRVNFTSTEENMFLSA